MRRFLIALIAVGMFLIVSTAPVAAKPPTVKVKLADYTITPSLQFIAKGKINLTVKNDGTVKHEVVIVRGTDPAALPMKPDGSVDEDQIPKADKLGELDKIKPRKSKSKVFKFKKGSYILFCNVTDTEPDGSMLNHFAHGMFTTIQAG